MDKENLPLIEMIAGTVGLFALIEECDSFSYLHMILGFMLVLFILRGIKRHKSLYEAVLYCAAASLPILLTLSKLLDCIRDKYFRDVVSRDVILALLWIVLLIILFIIERIIYKRDEVTHETY